MKIHLMCPFYRKNILKTQKHYLEPFNIEWHPICGSSEIDVFENNDKDWIHPFLCRDFQPHEVIVYAKINDFIDKYEIKDDDYYGCMGDDDMYEPNFFDEIRQQTSKIIMVSLSRGNAIPDSAVGLSRHPTDPLIIRQRSDVRRNAIGLPQFIVKGEVLKQERFDNRASNDDGIFAENLARKYPDEIKYMPHLFVFGNYFEHGRYTNDQWKLKPNWELPKIITEG